MHCYILEQVTFSCVWIFLPLLFVGVSFQTNDTFLTVEQKQADGSWKIIFTDADWETRYG